MATKLNNLPISNAPNPETIRSSKDFGKKKAQQNDTAPITANTKDQLLKLFMTTPFLLIIPI
jgi:hypothetical protein